MRQPEKLQLPAVQGWGAASRIYFCAVHEGTTTFYTWEQRGAWGGETINLDRWRTRIERLNGFVAEDAGEPVGFITIDATGYIDLAFVLPSTAGKGVGRRLLEAAEHWAFRNGAIRLTTKARLAARHFFEQNGWSALEEEAMDLRGVILKRY